MPLNDKRGQIIFQPLARLAHVEYEKNIYRLSKKLDEEVARLHLEKIGVVLTKS